jgi:hypothetical protein
LLGAAFLGLASWVGGLALWQTILLGFVGLLVALWIANGIAWFIQDRHRARALTPSAEPEQEAVYLDAAEDREKYQRYVVQQIEKGEAIKDWRFSEYRRGVLHPSRAQEKAWIVETYYGLKDRKPDDAEFFGGPYYFGDVGDRVDRLITILDTM